VVPGGVADDSRQVARATCFSPIPAISPMAGATSPMPLPVVPSRRALGSGACCRRGGLCLGRDWPVANLPVSGLRALRGPLAHAIYGRPSERLSLIAVTGTNGKTSVTQWIGATHPRSCAVIGTLGAGLPGQLVDTGFTTPEATTLARSGRILPINRRRPARSKRVRSASPKDGSTAHGWTSRCSPISLVITSIITPAWKTTHRPRRGCSPGRVCAWRCAISTTPSGRELAALTTATKVVGYTQRQLPS
jgi:hypothetical protein